MSNKHQIKTISLLTASVITTVSITLVLFLLGTTFLVGFTGKGFSSYLKESQAISIELADNADEASVARLQKQLAVNPYIKSTKYISKEEVKADLIKQLGHDPEEVLGYDRAKAYIDVHVKAEYMNPDSIGIVENSLKTKKLNIIQNVVYSKDDIAFANSNLSTLITILLSFTVVLILISFILIRSIIQLNIYSKRFLINTMRLVGATNSFIRRPFMSKMLLSGIIAATLANLSIWGMVYYIIRVFPDAASFVTQEQLWIVFGLVLISGILITTLATISAVNRYLKMTTNKLYRD